MEPDRQLVIQLFLAGWSEREIAGKTSLSATEVHEVVASHLRDMADRHDAMGEQATHLYVERLETMLKALWPKAMRGDVKAVETVRRLLEQQARVFGVGVDDEDTANPYEGPPLRLLEREDDHGIG